MSRQAVSLRIRSVNDTAQSLDAIETEENHQLDITHSSSEVLLHNQTMDKLVQINCSLELLHKRHLDRIIDHKHRMDEHIQFQKQQQISERKIDKLLASTRADSFYSSLKKYSNQYERLKYTITPLILIYLKNQLGSENVYKFYTNNLKIESYPNVFKYNIEWDGALLDTTSNILYLIKTNSPALESTNISQLVTRIERTIQFMTQCGTTEFKQRVKENIRDNSQYFNYISLCSVWSEVANIATAVYGVIGCTGTGSGFTDLNLTLTQKAESEEGLICVIPLENGMYRIQPSLHLRNFLSVSMYTHISDTEGSSYTQPPITTTPPLVACDISEEELSEYVEECFYYDSD